MRSQSVANIANYRGTKSISHKHVSCATLVKTTDWFASHVWRRLSGMKPVAASWDRHHKDSARWRWQISLRRPASPRTAARPSSCHGTASSTASTAVTGLCQVCGQVDWPTGQLADWPTGRLADWRTDGLTDWRTDGLTDWRTDGLTDWRTDGLTEMDWQTGRIGGRADGRADGWTGGRADWRTGGPADRQTGNPAIFSLKNTIFNQCLPDE